MFHFLLIVILVLLFLSIPTYSLSSSPTTTTTTTKDVIPCVWTDPFTGEHWKLVSSETFSDHQLDIQDWKIRQTWEADNCMDEFNHTQNCELRQNAQLLAGHLVMSARPKRLGRFNFTGAKVTGNTALGHGRLELRLAQPSGGSYLQTCVLLDTKINMYWSSSGAILVACFARDPNGTVTVYRSVDFGRGDCEVRPLTLTEQDKPEDFHLYGIEWDSRELRFFFDHNYTEPVRFNATRTLKPEQSLTFQIGYIDLNDPTLNSDSFDHLAEWKCPALIVDYVREYQRIVPGKKQLSKKKLPECKPKLDQHSQNVSMGQFCQLALSDPDWMPERTFWEQYRYFIAFFIATGALITALLMYQTKLWLSSRKNWLTDDGDTKNAYDYCDAYDYIYPQTPEVEIVPNYGEKLATGYLKVYDIDVQQCFQEAFCDSAADETPLVYMDMNALKADNSSGNQKRGLVRQRSKSQNYLDLFDQTDCGGLGGNSQTERCPDDNWCDRIIAMFVPPALVRRKSISTPTLFGWRGTEEKQE